MTEEPRRSGWRWARCRPDGDRSGYRPIDSANDSHSVRI